MYSADALGDKGALLALDSAGEELWRWTSGVQGVSAAALVDETAWVTTNTGFLVALDATTGAEGVRIPLGTTPSLSAPLIVGEEVYVPCRGPRLLAVGLDGERRWEYQAAEQPGGWLNQTPLALGQHLLAVLNRAGWVIALRPADGEQVWEVQLGPAGKDLSPPATDGERLYVGSREGLHALDPADGRELWHFSVERGVEAAPLVVGDVVYITCRNHYLYALDAAGGQELWRCGETERRIQVSPLVTAGPRPLAVIADRDGTVTALQRPLNPAEHESAGNWAEAASAYTALGQLTRAAELLEAHGRTFQAAGLWEEAGDLERAAEGYQAAGAWREAAKLWGQLDRPLRRAEALEGYARSVAKESAAGEVCADAWEAAVHAFHAAGEDKRAEACRREVARCRRLPYLAVEVKHDDLILNAWTRLRFIVHNQGFGPAHQLIIRARGDQFEGQVADTRQIITLRADQIREDRLDIRPLAYGDSVPLRVSIDYQDRTQTPHTWEKTVYLPVAKTHVTQEKPMTGIPSDIHAELRESLLNCGPFESDRQLRTVFADARLSPWRHSLPQADNVTDRVGGTILFLVGKRRADTKENALVLFLRVLSDGLDPADECHSRLAELADALELALAGSVSPAPHPTTIQPAKAKASSQVPQSDVSEETDRRDFFVSYNRADRGWAEWIAWQLEEAGYTTVIQAWDFRPGSNFIIDMQRAAERASRTIAVLSPDYVQALYTQPEWAAAFAQDPTGEKGTLLPVRVRECELRGLLSQVVYIDLAGLAEEVAKETLLVGVKQGRVKPTTAPGFPETVEHAASEQPGFPGESSQP
jgi:outer membrane protein assembly factor BamB